MNSKALFSFLCLFLFLVASCSTENISDEFETRLDILYEHTLEMERLSTETQLIEIGLDISYLDRDSAETVEDKIFQLEKSYGVETTGSYDERILQLEDIMAEMMYAWAQLE